MTSRLFRRAQAEEAGPALVDDQRAPEPGVNKLLVKAFEAAVIAVAVYVAMSIAKGPENTAQQLQDHDKRLALMEQSMGTIKDDLKDIKRAVIKR